MDEHLAAMVVDNWSSGSGVVSRGPKMLLCVLPASISEVERYTGRRFLVAGDVWRVEVGGRFLASGGLVYPGGVPFPEELHSQTAVIANELWLYADEEGDVLGAYWWPDALRKPIAAKPAADYPPQFVVHPADARGRVDLPVLIPALPPFEAISAACPSRSEVVVYCTHGEAVKPLNEMLVYERGGVSIRSRRETAAPDFAGFLRSHQPPFRRIEVGGSLLGWGIARDPGRSLGPQTWPWPGELRWWAAGITYEVKGFHQVATLVDVARSLSPIG